MLHNYTRLQYGTNAVLVGSTLRVMTEQSAPWGNVYSKWLTFPAAGTAVPAGYSGPSATMQAVNNNGISSFDQSNVTASQSGALTQGYVLGGDLSASFGGSLSLSLLVGVSGDLLASLTGDGSLATKMVLAGDAAAYLSASGFASLGTAIQGLADALTDAAGSLNFGVNVVGSADATFSDNNPQLGLLVYISGPADATASSDGNLEIMAVLAGDLSATVSQTGDISAPSLFSGLASAIFIGSLDLHGKLYLEGSTADSQYQQIANAVWAHESGTLVRQIIANKKTLDPATGILTLYGDDDVTPIAQIVVYSNVAGTIPYDGTAPIHNQGRLG